MHTQPASHGHIKAHADGRPAGSAFSAPKPLQPVNLTQDICAGDVVCCAFPFHTTPSRPGVYPRPCLVLQEQLIDNKRYFLVAYGTTKHLCARDRWPGDMVVSEADGSHFRRAGLAAATKFKLSQTALLPADSEFFPRPSARLSSKPVDGIRLGRFDEVYLDVLQRCFRSLRQFQAKQLERHGRTPAPAVGPLMPQGGDAAGFHAPKPARHSP